MKFEGLSQEDNDLYLMLLYAVAFTFQHSELDKLDRLIPSIENLFSRIDHYQNVETVNLYEKKQELENIIVQLVDELDWQGRTDHRSMTIQALRAADISDDNIKGYFEGNIIL